MFHCRSASGRTDGLLVAALSWLAPSATAQAVYGGIHGAVTDRVAALCPASR